MANESQARGTTEVRDEVALLELKRAEELQERASRIDDQIERLLEPLEDALGALALERDRLFHQALAARQKFFQAARKADPGLGTHRGLRYTRKGEQVCVVWDDAGPQFSDADDAELPQLKPFVRQVPGRLVLSFRSRGREGA
ncbi:MAG TPA: hypothetical protein VFR85_20035 [Anaeromyxobacteraceae bacterium]|nr:hypothetical protein [Anaeromyxobacteraceae bacterium]